MPCDTSEAEVFNVTLGNCYHMLLDSGDVSTKDLLLVGYLLGFGFGSFACLGFLVLKLWS